jgi:hypothetical protein
MPVTPSTIDTMQGLTFTFNSLEFRVTSLKVKRASEKEDVSDCTQAVGTRRKYQVKPLKPGDVLTLEYWGKNPPAIDAAYAIACTALGITGVNAICDEAEEGGAAGDFVKGTATFTITG